MSKRTATGGGLMAVLETYREVKAKRRKRRKPIVRRVIIPNALASKERRAAYDFHCMMAKEVR